MIAPVRVSAWGPRFIGVRRAPLLIWVLGASAGAGDKMAIGVSRRVRPLILGRLSGAGPAATRLLELAAGSSVGRARNARPEVAGTQAAGARTWSSRLRRVWWQRRASLRAIDNNASCPPRRALTCWK